MPPPKIVFKLADFAGWMALKLIPAKVLSRPKLFHAWERRGLHIMPVGHYSPIPTVKDLEDADFNRVSEMPGIDMRDADQVALLAEFCRDYQDAFASFPERPALPPGARPGGDPATTSTEYYVDNGYFGTPDAEALYGMVRRFRPRRIIEVGSGHSTRVFARALRDAAAADPSYKCDFTTIDPVGGEVLKGRLPAEARMVKEPVQKVPYEEFLRLGENDILFIDSGHVTKTGGDVNYQYLEVLPRLRRGVVVHCHDILFPGEYPRSYFMIQRFFWNEQYLLQAFLAFNNAFRVLWSSSWMAHYHKERLRATMPNYGRVKSVPAASFWMQRVE